MPGMPVKFQKESWFDGFGILLVPYPWYVSLKTLQSGLSALAQNVIAFRKKDSRHGSCQVDSEQIRSDAPSSAPIAIFDFVAKL